MFHYLVQTVKKYAISPISKNLVQPKVSFRLSYSFLR